MHAFGLLVCLGSIIQHHRSTLEGEAVTAGLLRLVMLGRGGEAPRVHWTRGDDDGVNLVLRTRLTSTMPRPSHHATWCVRRLDPRCGCIALRCRW